MISRLEKGSLGDLQLAALFSLVCFSFFDGMTCADSDVAIFLEKRKNDQVYRDLGFL